MKNLFPKNAQVIVLKEDNNKVLLFTPLSEVECEILKTEVKHYMQLPNRSDKKNELDDNFYNIFRFKFADILGIGDNKVEPRLANLYIENNSITYFGKEKGISVTKRNYKCFVRNDWKTGSTSINAPYHEDGGCSWNCLMQKLKYPKFGVIYGMRIEDFKIKYPNEN